VCKTSGLSFATLKLVNAHRKVAYHLVIVACIITGNAQDLFQVSRDTDFIYQQTLCAMLKSSNILANTAARAAPVCNFATSIKSSSMAIGKPPFCKWTVTAT
jgi:hypothetical protein